jgi:hypothetical protein
MTTYPQKITFGEMRASGVRDVLIYCRDYRCRSGNRVSAHGWHTSKSEARPLATFTGEDHLTLKRSRARHAAAPSVAKSCWRAVNQKNNCEDLEDHFKPPGSACRAAHLMSAQKNRHRKRGAQNRRWPLPPLLTQYQGSPRGDGTDGARSRLTIRYRHGALRRSDRRAVSVVVTLSLLSSSVVMTRCV